MENSPSSSLPIVAWVGLDWADQPMPFACKPTVLPTSSASS